MQYLWDVSTGACFMFAAWLFDTNQLLAGFVTLFIGQLVLTASQKCYRRNHGFAANGN